jgi:hypothetical protein
MGNNSSTIKHKSSWQNMTSMSQDIKKLSDSNSKFLSKLNDIATNYILGQNFQDMVRLTNSRYCDDLVIITSKLLKKSYLPQEIHYAYQKIFNKSIGVGVGLEQTSPLVLNKRDAILGGIMSTEQKKKMCIDIAKYYVKIAHLFAAIITTLNPVFSWRSSASSSRALLRPHVSEEKQEEIKFTTTLEDKHYISEMAKDIKAILATAKKSKGVRIYHELDDTYYSVTSDTFIGRVYKDFGVINVADAAAGADSYGYPQLSAEYLLKSDPQAIFLSDAQYGVTTESVSKRAGWSEISAVKNGNVFALAADVPSRWGPRLVDFYRAIAKALVKIS